MQFGNRVCHDFNEDGVIAGGVIGFYYFIKFESEDASTPNELEASLRIFEPVVRYLIVRDETVEQPAQAE